MKRIALGLHALGVGSPPPAGQGEPEPEEITLQPADGIDTCIIVNTPTYNYGATAQMNVGAAAAGAGAEARGLLAFDLSALPAGATIVSAVLTLYCEYENAADDRVVGVHRALTQWFEGAQNGAAPGAGEDGSNWNLRNANGSLAWAGGAGGAAGSDWTALATDTELITGVGAFTWDVADDVQAWLDEEADNYGWWLINVDGSTANSRKRFTSSDSGNAANRPKLAITYTT